MDRAAAENLISDHPPTGDQAQIYASNRAVFSSVLDHVYDVLPEPSAERTLTVRKVAAALRDLNAAVAVTGAGAATAPAGDR